ncbi:NO-inducible flavohemoprotein [Thalassotalea ganghwensis]
MLSIQTINVIKSTVPLLEEHGRAITDVFYKNLFEHHPFLKNIFNMANQGKGEQSRALSDAVITYAKNIDNVEILIPTVQRIAHKHASLGIKKLHYSVVGATLLGAIQEVLSINEKHPAIIAWGEAYGILADVFINVEQEIYNENKQQTGGWEGFRDFYIDRIEQEANRVKSFYFKPVDLESVPEFKGGQYVGVRVRPNGSEHYQIRQYSLSSFGEFKITVKAEPSGVVSNYLHDCKVSDAIQLQAPTGVFTLKDNDKKNIFIAGGVGITPMMSMLEESLFRGKGNDENMFIQCSKDEDHQIFAEKLKTLSFDNQFIYKRCFENSSAGDHKGYLSVEIIEEWLASNDYNTTNSQVYICGPKPFMAVLNQFFIAIGYDTENIHYEVFGPTTIL